MRDFLVYHRRGAPPNETYHATIRAVSPAKAIWTLGLRREDVVRVCVWKNNKWTPISLR